MPVLALTGFPASGKSTAADQLADAGYPVVSMGETLRTASGTTDEDDVWVYAQTLREDHGAHGVAVPCVDPLRAHLADPATDLVVLEGTRNPAEAAYLERELDTEVAVVWIAANFDDRVEWFAAREGRGSGAENHVDTAHYLRERTDRERAAGMKDYFTRADRIMTNYGTLDELEQKIRAYARTLTHPDLAPA